MIEAVFLDIDGVLTDGSVWIDARGEETKRLFFDDIDAIFALKRAGIQIGFISGEDTPFCDYLQKRFEPTYFIRGCKNKLMAFQQIEKETGLRQGRVCFVGDSLKDTDLLCYVAHSLTPADTEPAVNSAAKTVLCCERGKGVVRETARYVFLYNQRELKGGACSA